MILPPRDPAHTQKLRSMATDDGALVESTNLSRSFGLPIRAAIGLKDAPRPPKADERCRNRLKKEARDWTTSSDADPDPYPILLRASLAESTFPTVSGRIQLSGIDSTDADPTCEFTSDSILLDTGAHSSIIAEDLLPDRFRQYLISNQNDPFRSGDRTRVQVDGTLIFSNQAFMFNTIFVVVPRRTIKPNGNIGILLGQRGLLDRITFRSVPWAVLKARGEDIEAGIYGDIIITEYINLNEKPITLWSEEHHAVNYYIPDDATQFCEICKSSLKTEIFCHSDNHLIEE